MGVGAVDGEKHIRLFHPSAAAALYPKDGVFYKYSQVRAWRVSLVLESLLLLFSSACMCSHNKARGFHVTFRTRTVHMDTRATGVVRCR